jgi:hypothetical protein
VEKIIREWIASFRKRWKREPSPFDLAANMQNTSDGDAMKAMVAFFEQDHKE